MATIAFQPSSSARSGRGLTPLPRPGQALREKPALTPTRSLEREIPLQGIRRVDHVLPLSGCQLSVLDLPDGGRVGRLYAPHGQWLAEAECAAQAQVSGFFGRRRSSGTSWALAFGAGGGHEALNVRFAGLRARRVVPVVSDLDGLWVAEVAGAFRAATILGPATNATIRLHYVAR